MFSHLVTANVGKCFTDKYSVQHTFVVSGFSRVVNEIFPRLEFYAA